MVFKPYLTCSNINIWISFATTLPFIICLQLWLVFLLLRGYLYHVTTYDLCNLVFILWNVFLPDTSIACSFVSLRYFPWLSSLKDKISTLLSFLLLDLFWLHSSPCYTLHRYFLKENETINAIRIRILVYFVHYYTLKAVSVMK